MIRAARRLLIAGLAVMLGIGIVQPAGKAIVNAAESQPSYRMTKDKEVYRLGQDEIRITISGEGMGTGIDGAEARLSYDTSKLEYKQVISSGGFTGQVEREPGKLVVYKVRTGQNQSISGDLFTIVFAGKAVGTSQLQLTEVHTVNRQDQSVYWRQGGSLEIRVEAAGASPSPTATPSPSPTTSISPSPTSGTTPSPTNGTTPSPTNGTTPSPTNGTTPSPTSSVPTPTAKPGNHTGSNPVDLKAEGTENGKYGLTALFQVDSVQLLDAVKAAKNKEELLVQVPSVSDAAGYGVTLPASVLNEGTRKTSIRIETELGTVLLPTGMLSNQKADGANVQFQLNRVDPAELPESLRGVIGSRPVLDLSLSAGGKTVEWNNPSAPVTVTVPYTPTADELRHPNKIVIWYIDGKGQITTVPNGRYDSKTGTITFQVTHFSLYAAVYVDKTFKDLSRVEWAREAVEAMAARGVVQGTGQELFQPEATIKRADFIVMLVRAMGLQSSTAIGKESGFIDISTKDYYYEAVHAAQQLGIVKGDDQQRLRPNEAISRQDVWVLMTRAMALNHEASAPNISVLVAFLDANEVAGYAKESTALLVEAGIVQGSNQKLTPRDSLTRAQAAVLLDKLLQL